jgi:Transcriptional regulator containing an amidase domain and an AraC-type DNA-binding HTH domain
MRIPRRDYPKKYNAWTNHVTNDTKRFPFYIKECGYCNSKKFETKKEHSYSDILILYNCEGSVFYIKHDSEVKLRPHQVIISSCSSPIQFRAARAKWNFFYTIISGSHSKLFYNLIRTTSDIISTDPLMSLQDYFIELVNLRNSVTSDTDMKASLLLHSIFHNLYTCSLNIIHAKEKTPIQESDLNTALNFIKQNYQKDLSLDIICKEVNLSKYYFCKIFKKHMGISMHKYLNEYRINKSKDLLMYSNLSVTAISREVGFKTVLSYIRCFKQATQLTPSEYRENY